MRRMVWNLNFSWVVLLGAAVVAFAQAKPQPVFEVASVRVSRAGTRPSQRVTPDRVDLTATSIRSVLLRAFQVNERLLFGPEWLREVRLDIHATIPSGAAREHVPDMLRALLVDRLGLVARSEQRPMDAYELVIGRNGVTMQEAKPANELTKVFPVEPSLPSSSFNDVRTGEGDDQVRTMMLPTGIRTITARSVHETRYTERRTTEITAIRMSMAELSTLLTSNLDQFVLDRTGLKGVYQFKIELPPDQRAVRSLLSRGITADVKGTPLSEPTGVSVEKAIEALGLRLEKRRVPFTVVVVDKIDRVPTAN